MRLSYAYALLRACCVSIYLQIIHLIDTERQRAYIESFAKESMFWKKDNQF